jgi:hypothetical protein
LLQLLRQLLGLGLLLGLTAQQPLQPLRLQRSQMPLLPRQGLLLQRPRCI